uniref:Immunoglobulin domain-containing protein n=1 Tax=Cyprinus carpio carpio TaxID=630221 RepID=A0A9J7YAH5_CYPCA
MVCESLKQKIVVLILPLTNHRVKSWPSVKEGDSVTLHSGLTGIQTDDVLQWRFGPQGTLIAQINRARKISTYDGPDGRFRHSLQLDYMTGSLTIKNIGIRHSGLYEVDISTSSSKHTIHKSFSVTVSGEMKSETVKEGESVTLRTGFTEVQIYDFMTWMFGDTIIAEINKGAQLYDDDERFRDRLQLDNQTGSLTITNCTISNSGLYELNINIKHNFIFFFFYISLLIVCFTLLKLIVLIK